MFVIEKCNLWLKTPHTDTHTYPHLHTCTHVHTFIKLFIIMIARGMHLLSKLMYLIRISSWVGASYSYIEQTWLSVAWHRIGASLSAICVKLPGSDASPSDSFLNLGVVFDSNLHFRQSVSQLFKSCLCDVCDSSHCFNRALRKRLHTQFEQNDITFWACLL